MIALRIGFSIILLISGLFAAAQQIIVAGEPGQLTIRPAGEHSIRITLKPLSFKEEFPFTRALAERKYSAPAITLTRIEKTIKKTVGNLVVEIKSNPLNIIVTNRLDQPVQNILFNEEGTLSFKVNNEPILGLGEGGSKPAPGINWRSLPVEYDRRGRYDSMQPRWQADAYG